MRASPLSGVEELSHGVFVRDPYRWLEDRSLPETEEWIREQSARCESYFSGCSGFGTLRDRVQKLLDLPVEDQQVRVGKSYFFRRRESGQEQTCIYVRDIETNRERLLVDPREHGAFSSVGIHRVSEDASLVAYEVKRGGADTKEIRIVHVASGSRLPLQIEEGYMRGFVFAPLSHGFYYCQETPSDEQHVIRFQSYLTCEVRIVFSRPRTPGGRLLLTGNSNLLGAMWVREKGTQRVCECFVMERKRDVEWRPVFKDKSLPFNPILYKDRIFVLSFEGAPNGEIIELNLDGEVIRSVVPEGVTPLRYFAVAGGRIYVNSVADGKPSIRSWTLEGDFAGELDLPTDGTIQLLAQFTGEAESFFYTHESFSSPKRIYEYETSSGRTLPWNCHSASISDDRYETRCFSFQAKDGTSVPLSLIMPIPGAKSGLRPVIMTSYGGFGVATTQQFSVFVKIMLDLGVLFAIAHVRGGGEFGREWHDAGRARHKLTSIEDFTSAAEWLCSEGISCPSQLAIFGGSNSGLLVGAAMTQRPDLFRAVLCIAPLLDMMRYERFDDAGRWKSEYGSVTDPEEFRALLAYSPYHNVRESVNYPATLFFTGDRDDRCNPAHVRKMAARLQTREAQRSDVLVDYSSERGHSPTLPLSVRVEALTRRLAFMVRELGLEIPLGVIDETTCC